MKKHKQQRRPLEEFDAFIWLHEASKLEAEREAEFHAGQRKYGVTFVGAKFFPLLYHLFDEEGHLIGATRSRGQFVSAYCPYYSDECVYSAPVSAGKKSSASKGRVTDYLGFNSDDEPHYEQAARKCLEWRDRQIQAGQDLRLLADACLHKEHYEYLAPISPDEFCRDEERWASLSRGEKRKPGRLNVSGVILEKSPRAPFDAYVMRDERESPIGYAQVRLGVFRVVAPGKPGENIYKCISFRGYATGPERPGRIVYRTAEGVSEGEFNTHADRDRLLAEAVRAVQEHTMSP